MQKDRHISEKQTDKHNILVYALWTGKSNSDDITTTEATSMDRTLLLCAVIIFLRR